MIEIDLTHPDLMPSDRRSLNEVVALTNYRIAVGDFEPLRLSIETYHSQTFRSSRDAERAAFLAGIEDARRSGDSELANSIDAVMRSRVVHAELMDDVGYQLWDLLD